MSDEWRAPETGRGGDDGTGRPAEDGPGRAVEGQRAAAGDASGTPAYGTPPPYGTPPSTPYGTPAPYEPPPAYRTPSPPPYGTPTAGPGAYPRAYPGVGYAYGRTSGFAIASLILSLVWVFWLGSVLAVIFGHIALNEIRRDPAVRGRGLAVAGLVLGYVGLALLLLGILGSLAVQTPS